MNTVAIAIFVALFAAIVVLVVTNLGAKGKHRKKPKKLSPGARDGHRIHSQLLWFCRSLLCI